MSVQKQRNKFKSKKVLYRDKETFKVFQKTQYLSKEHLERLNFSERSIERYLKTETLQREIVFHNKQEVEVFKLTDYGREWLQKEVFNCKMHFYKSNAVNHDLALSETVINLITSEANIKIDDFKSEREILQEFREHIKELREQGQHDRAEQLEQQRSFDFVSPPDLVLKLESGETIAIEITTAGYSEAQIQAKENFTQAMNYQSIEYIKI